MGQDKGEWNGEQEGQADHPVIYGENKSDYHRSREH